MAADGTLTFTLAADANGSATIQVRARDDGGTFNGGVDVSEPRTFAITATPVPDVASVVVNGGADQRSRVTEMTVTFDMEVDAALLATAFTLTRHVRRGRPSGPITVTTRVENGRTVATLTFAGANTEFGSLADGRWTLSVDRAKVKSPTGVEMAAGHSYPLHRLFGDANGDGVVTDADVFQFRRAYGTAAGQPGYRADLDFDGDGFVTNAGRHQFGPVRRGRLTDPASAPRPGPSVPRRPRQAERQQPRGTRPGPAPRPEHRAPLDAARTGRWATAC